MTSAQKSFFSLIRLAFGHSEAKDFQEPSDWSELIALCRRQNLSPLCVDGLQKLYEENPGFQCALDANKSLRINWFSDTVSCETNYAKHFKVISRLAKFYAGQGLKMMLLKGYGLSLNYPTPNHRNSGDIDIFLFRDSEEGIPAWKAGDIAMEKENGIKADNSHHHHSVFHYNGRSVENHFDFINIYGHKSSREIEAVLKSLAAEGKRLIKVEGQDVYLPSADFNALFLAKHCALHFSSEGLEMRQILDWACFLQTSGKDIDWDRISALYKKYRLLDFVGVLNSIAIEQAGFQRGIFPFVSEDKELVSRILADVLDPEFKGRENGRLLSSLIVKPSRWWANRWKHRLCFPDSLASGFAYTLMAKIMKPAHFIK